MKQKLIIEFVSLMLILGIGLANTPQVVFDKDAMHPKRPDPADLIVVTNGFYDLIIETDYGIGTYTVRTGSNHPATVAAGGVKQNVLYGGAYGNPWSTYLTVKSYTSNTNYYTRTGTPYPDSGCTGVQLDNAISSITQPTPTSVLCVWNITGMNDYLTIKQNTFIDGTTLDDSKIGVTATVKNTGNDTVKIGIRYEWDIMIDGNDASIFRTKNPQGPWLNTETQWSNIYYTHYEITDNQYTPTFYNLGTATGPSYLTPPPTPPDLLSYASWYYSYSNAFNYTVQGLSGYDSAILYYWGDNLANAKILAPGDSIMVTQYLFASLFTFTYQADNHIKNSNEGTYIGDNIYNLNGEGQTKTQNASTVNPAVYHIKIENDGNGSDGFIVNELTTDRQNWNVSYYDALIGGNNITSEIQGSGWSTGALNPGQFREIRMEVIPDAGVANGSTKTIDVMSTSVNDNAKKDVVRTITTAGIQGVHDVGAYQIISPSGVVNVGDLVIPKTVVQNYGDFTESFSVNLSFNGYSDTKSVFNLAPGAIDTVEFDGWTAVPGWYLVKSYTMLSGDEDPENDTTYMEFYVSAQMVDVAIVDILVPSEPIVSCYDYEPAVLIHTSGASGPVPCSVLVRITRFPSRMISYCNVGVDSLNPIVEYEEWVYTMVNPDYDTVYLPSWHPYWWDIDWTQYPAYHLVYAEVISPNDENPNNNSMLKQFTVDGRPNDLQMNWTGLLNGYEVIHDETIPNVTYNVASAVSLSEGGPNARFRSWVKIIREADNAV
ncbi:MAG: hypothetical protein ABIL70_07430, partial [candidate division WOR-3 bacterium]